MGRKSFTSEFKSNVALEAIKGHKTVNELASEFGVHPSQIAIWKKQLVELSKTAFTRKQQIKAQQSAEEERERLYAQIGKLKVELDWLKPRKSMVDSHHPKLAVSRQCKLLQVSRSSYYHNGRKHFSTESEENLLLMRLIDEEYMRHPFLGSRKLRDYLSRQGYPVNRKRV